MNWYLATLTFQTNLKGPLNQNLDIVSSVILKRWNVEQHFKGNSCGKLFRVMKKSKVKVVRYSFSWTIPSIFNCCFTNLSLDWLMWKLHQFLEKDWSFVECDFQGNKYFYGNIPKNWKSVMHEFYSKQICHRQADANFQNYDV